MPKKYISTLLRLQIIKFKVKQNQPYQVKILKKFNYI